MPIAARATARLLEALAAAEPAGRVLEIGTGIGYSTLHLARGAREGRVVSIDLDGERQEVARELLSEAGVAARVELIQGAALERLPGLAPPFHLVFLDGAPGELRRSLDLALPLVAVGGRIVVDHLLCGGWVAEPERRPESGAPEAEAIERFNPYLQVHPQLATVLLPLGDGVGLAVKRRPTLRELGGPY